jgi:ketosteroid isomerase-like protein
MADATTTVAEHPNLTLLKRGYEAFDAGDMDTIRELFDPDIVWHVPGKNHTSGTYRGLDNVLGTLVQNVQETEGTLKLELHDALANDTHGVALLTARGSKDGRSLESRLVQVFHVKDSRVTEAWLFSEDERAGDEFWG